jgi:DNA sulfur modification protein DndD
LYGKYGLRYCEGFRGNTDSDSAGYRKAIDSYRRVNADSQEPTEVVLTFAPNPAKDSPRQKEVRIIRRWHFTSQNRLKQGDAGEEVQVFIGDKPVKTTDLDEAASKIESGLFPPSVMPAFFFDGEQARSLIEKMGEDGMRKAVEVMFGMKIVAEVRETLRGYLSNMRGRLGGKGKAPELQARLDKEKVERDELDTAISKIQKSLIDLRHELEQLKFEREDKMEKLALSGGEASKDAAGLAKLVANADNQRSTLEKQLTTSMARIGIPLGLARLGTAIRNRLNSEAARESWENLRTGTLERRDEVIDFAMPEPISEDPILNTLNSEQISGLKARLFTALDRIYNPPPINCADDYILGHVKGDQRARLIQKLEMASAEGSAQIIEIAEKLKVTRENLADLTRQLDRATNLPKEVQEYKERIVVLNDQIGNLTNRLGQLENEINGKKSRLHDLNANVQRLQEEIALLEPEQRRLAIAERVNRVIEDLLEQLAPTTAKRLEQLVTNHFLKIADDRFKEGTIHLRPDDPPQIVYTDGRPSANLEVMSGFESRSFGIAFSLALAEITKRRIPLVIDTPLGNADSQYRPRLLKALAEFDLDQVIILTHDKEVDAEVYEQIKKNVNQTFLVKFDPVKKRSEVHADKYFGSTK